jgi:hypothetical protein
MSATIKNCNFSCVCNRDDCDRKHYIENKADRLLVKELYEKLFDRRIHNETDPEGVRNTPCYYGPLCGKEECNFKHYCRFEFREMMSKEWRKIARKENRERVFAEMKAKYKITEEDMEKLIKL